MFVRRTAASSVLFFALVSPLAAQTAAKSTPAQTPAIAREVDRLRSLAGVLKLDLGPLEQSGGDRNMVGIRSKEVLLSRRLDSRTFFIQDERYGKGTSSGSFAVDQELIRRARQVLIQLEVPEKEISQAIVLTEKAQAGQVDPATSTVRAGKIIESRKYVHASRTIEGIPIFSSRALIGLSKGQQIGFLEVHWPVIPESTLSEARKLQQTVQGGWRPPQQRGASIESVEAGVIHSPSVGFVMDIYPAIRVVYASEDKTIGRKLTDYLDDKGENVRVPRQFEKIDEAPVGTRQGKPASATR